MTAADAPDRDALARACARKMYDDDEASRLLGMEVTVERPGEATVVMTVDERMINGHEVCHGGYVFTLADSAFAFACNGYDRVTLAAGASIDFLRPVKLGDRLAAHAREVSRSRRSGIYDVEVQNQDGKTVAVFRGRSVALEQPMLDDGERPGS